MDCIQDKLGVSLKDEILENVQVDVSFESLSPWISRLGVLPLDYLVLQDKRNLVKILFKLERIGFSSDSSDSMNSMKSIQENVKWIAMIRSLSTRWIPLTLDQFPLLESSTLALDYMNTSLQLLDSCFDCVEESIEDSLFKDTCSILEYTWQRMMKRKMNLELFIHKFKHIEWNEWTITLMSLFLNVLNVKNMTLEERNWIQDLAQVKIIEYPRMNDSLLNLFQRLLPLTLENDKKNLLSHFINEFVDNRNHSKDTRAKLFCCTCEWIHELDSTDSKKMLSQIHSLLDSSIVSQACISLSFDAQKYIANEILTRIHESKECHLLFLCLHLQILWNESVFTKLLNQLFLFVSKSNEEFIIEILSSLTLVIKEKNVILTPLHVSLIMTFLSNIKEFTPMNANVFKTKTILLNAIVRHQREALIQVIPSFIQVLRELLQNFKFQSLEAFHYSQILSSMTQKPSREYLDSTLGTLNASFVKPFSKYVPFLVLEFMTIQSSCTPFEGQVKAELIQGMFSLLDCCHEHGHDYILCQLNGGARPLFKNLISEWERCHCYKGKD